MIQEYKDFITQEICKELIEICDQNLTRMTTLGQEIDGFRIADGTWVDRSLKISDDILDKISDVVRLPKENMESIHLVKYNIGGEYKEHHDFFHPGESYHDECISRGGQRLKSALIYLNDDFSGGETYFPAFDRKIQPEKTKMVVWDNMIDDDSLDYDSIHAGLPVTLGVKYIAIVWIRRNKFI
jgi:prolyl 4-hydroxylase